MTPVIEIEVDVMAGRNMEMLDDTGAFEHVTQCRSLGNDKVSFRCVSERDFLRLEAKYMSLQIKMDEQEIPA